MMNKILRFLLPFLILLGMIAAFTLESRMQLSSSGHTVVQIFIVVATCWLAWHWVVYDEMSSLRAARKSEPIRVHHYAPYPVEEAEILQNAAASQRVNRTAKVVTGKTLQPLYKNQNKSRDMLVSPVKVAHALMSVGIVFALTGVMLIIGSKTLGEGVIAILYLIPIGWCTVRWGQLAGVGAALTAALSFDFLFIPPYGTFHIGSLEGWLLLILFIGMAILIVGRIQSILTAERERERKATFLYEVVAAISSQATREGVAQAIASHIQEKFLADGVHVHFSGGYGYPSLTAYGNRGQAASTSEKPDRVLPIVAGATQIGEIDIWKGTIPLPFENDLMMQTMLRQITAALDRVRVAEGKPPYPKHERSYPEGDSLQASHS